MSNELRRSCTTHSVFSRSKIQSQKPINQSAVRFERIRIKTCVCIQCIICVLAECWFERQHPSVRIFVYGGNHPTTDRGERKRMRGSDWDVKQNIMLYSQLHGVFKIQCRFGLLKHVSHILRHENIIRMRNGLIQKIRALRQLYTVMHGCIAHAGTGQFPDPAALRGKFCAAVQHMCAKYY